MTLHDSARATYLAVGRRLSNNRALDAKWFLEQEVNSWDNWVRMPLGRRLALWRRGFTSPCQAWYDFDRYGFDDYLSETQRNRLYRACNGDHRYLIDDKLSQHWMLAGEANHRPTAFGLLHDGRVHGTADTVFDGPPESLSPWLGETLRREGRLVVKHLRGKGGKEVFVPAYDEEAGFTLDGEPMSEQALCSRLASLSGYLVSAYVDQHSYAAALYPGSSNTVRLLSIWDDQADELLVPAAVHRIGTRQSQPVDNFNAGGLTAWIDRDDGTLSEAVRFQHGETTRHERHPDTGAQIAGERVAQFETIRSTVERLALRNTNIPIIGWDILLNEAGDPVVLEANTGTGLDIVQIHRPLLANPRVRTVASRYLSEVKPP